MKKGSPPHTSGIGRTLLGALALVALVAFTVPQVAQASTAAGTSIENTVTVDYQSTGGVGYQDTASVTVTVSLVKVAPSVAFISQNPVASVANPTDENTTVDQIYSIYSNANGAVEHTINLATYAPTNIGAATNITASSNVWLGASTLAFPATADTDIYVPFDGTDDSEILTGDATAATQGIKVNDYVMIDGTKYQVTGITEDTSGDTNLPVGLQGDFAKLTLDAALTANPGMLITEYQEFTVSLDTAALTGSNTSGDYAGSIDATDGANTSTAVPTSVNVARASLTVNKEVWDGSAWVTTLNAAPNSTLQYRITVTNNTVKPCSSVVIADALSPYIAFQSTGDPTFSDDGTNPSNLIYGSATISYTDQDGAAHTLSDQSGGAPAGFDADVAQVKVDFGGQTMDGNGKFTLTYDVKVY